ncbi:hypothetical protein K523DRAFT_26902 [Schizophyllum commune Tattone D]|nr:hypothetical protein K523DRAFT_26902 [Schizophyllum commune Tattone D]
MPRENPRRSTASPRQEHNQRERRPRRGPTCGRSPARVKSSLAASVRNYVPSRNPRSCKRCVMIDEVTEGGLT